MNTRKDDIESIQNLQRAECIVRGNELQIRSVKAVSDSDFSEQILSDLIAQGLSGEELLTVFKQAQNKVRPAVLSMLSEVEAVARGEAEYETADDIFGED